MSIGSSTFAKLTPLNPAPASSAPVAPESAREKAAAGPDGSLRPSATAASANPVLKKGFSSRERQHRNASRPPGRSAFLRLPNAAAGSSKNMTPKLLSTRSNVPAGNG
jgi:hypothetical protein